MTSYIAKEQFKKIFDGGKWTPLSQKLCKRYGVSTAAVFGRVWRYSVGPKGYCHASETKIADELGISQSTVNRAINQLLKDGFLKLLKWEKGKTRELIVPNNIQELITNIPTERLRNEDMQIA